MESVTIDKTHQRLSFGPKEWIAVLALFLGPTASFGTWAWRQSDRTLVLENTMARQTEILQRLDSAREKNAVVFDRVDRIETRIQRLENGK